MYPTIKRNFRIVELLFVTYVMVGLSLLSACNSRVEGCLDIAAENFDLNADKSCDNCCKYPSASITLSQKWSDRFFQTTDTLLDVHGQPYFITDLKYILTSFAWQDADNINYTVDSATILCGANEVRYSRDLLQIDSKTFNYTLDTIRLFPFAESILMKLGWPPQLECVDESNLNHPQVFLETNPLYDHSLDKRAAIRLIIQPDVNVPELDTIFIHACYEISLDYSLDMPAGVDVIFDFTVNYADWFSDIDVNRPEEIPSIVLSNIEGSFTRTP